VVVQAYLIISYGLGVHYRKRSSILNGRFCNFIIISLEAVGEEKC